MDNQPPPLGDIAETRRLLGCDDTEGFRRVIEDGMRRLDHGLSPTLPYKDVTDPVQAYLLARAEQGIRTFKQVHPDGADHLMHDLKHISEDHYSVFLTPWQDAGRAAMRQLHEFACWLTHAEKREVLIETNMNGVVVRFNRRSRPEKIRRDWLRALDGCTNGPIGPRVPHELDQATLRRDYRIITVAALTRALQNEAEKAKLQERQRQLDAALIGLPEMEIGDDAQENLWQEAATCDPSVFVIRFGKTWARLMQAEMAKGKSLAEIIQPTYRLAHGITPALFGSEVGAVLNYVALTWVHRDEFRRHADKISTIHRIA